jgi:hypothetical protein
MTSPEESTPEEAFDDESSVVAITDRLIAIYNSTIQQLQTKSKLLMCGVLGRNRSRRRCDRLLGGFP